MARFSSNPTTGNWKALINYIAGTRKRFLLVNPQDSVQPLQCYSDTGWGGESQRSSYGVFISFHGVPILWIVRRLHTVAASTCQAEYTALGIATRQLLWVHKLIEDIMGHTFVGQLICDNESAIEATRELVHTDREYYITNQALFDKKSYAHLDSH